MKLKKAIDLKMKMWQALFYANFAMQAQILHK